MSKKRTTAEAMLIKDGWLPEKIAAVKINNEILPLSAKVGTGEIIKLVLLDSKEGAAVYRRSLAFLLAAAAKELFPQQNLFIGHSLGRSFYYTFDDEVTPDIKRIEMLETKMHELAKKNLPIVCKKILYSEALAIFIENHQSDTAKLLSGRNDSKVRINQCGDFVDLYIAPLVNSTGVLNYFKLTPYQEGFILRFPAAGQSNIEPFIDNPKIYEVYREHKKWGRSAGVKAVGQLNETVSNGNIRDYIHVTEAYQQKKLDAIASMIYEKKDDVKAVLIAGPSSSGKTTTSKRLTIALKVMGIEPITISLDDYYLGTNNAPLDEDGKPDYECLEALDVPYLNKQLLDLLSGKEVTLPVFDFKSGSRREDGGRTIRMNDKNILVIEGIHGLNDALTPQIERCTKFKIYVSALTQLNLDDHNRIPTSDNRLLRRIVRDNQFRRTIAEKTFEMWPSVQRGERKYIFPFQNEADAAFNSALDYELAVLKIYAEPLLRSIKPGMNAYSEAVRLLSFLNNFIPIPSQYVPGQSILREFIGDSDFKY